MVNRRRLGNDKEQLAAAYLTGQGYRVLQTNFYCHGGEIDIIAEEGGYLCFIEVKYRSDTADGFPEDAVDMRKIRRISRSAVSYLHMCGLSDTTPCRFDVVSILGDNITLIRDAFDAII